MTRTKLGQSQPLSDAFNLEEQVLPNCSGLMAVDRKRKMSKSSNLDRLKGMANYCSSVHLKHEIDCGLRSGLALSRKLTLDWLFQSIMVSIMYIASSQTPLAVSVDQSPMLLIIAVLWPYTARNRPR